MEHETYRPGQERSEPAVKEIRARRWPVWLALGLSLPFIALGLWIGLSLNEPVHRFLHDFRDDYTSAQWSLIMFGRYLGWLVLGLAFVQLILLIVGIFTMSRLARPVVLYAVLALLVIAVIGWMWLMAPSVSLMQGLQG